MTKEEKELTITYLTEMQEEYIEGEGYERHPLPEYYALDMAIKALEQQPCEDCVSLEVYKQVMSERDIAIEQLRELGYDFGEKIRPSEDCVSRQAVDLLCFKYLKPNNDDNVAFYEHFCELPPVTPTIPKGATNGDMIKAMFPKIEIYTDVINEIVDVEICEDSSELRCSVDWWDAPYKGV